MLGRGVTYFEQEMFPLVDRVGDLRRLLAENEAAHGLHLIMIEFFVIYRIIFLDRYT